MNYYKRHLGDIAKSLSNLSQGQMGAYDLLLDWLYANEKPLPLAMDEIYQIGRCRTKAERANVDRVLAYFERTDQGYTQKRATEEIEAYAHRCEVNSKTGRLGGRPKAKGNGTQSITDSVSSNNPSQNPEARKEQELPTQALTDLHPGKPGELEPRPVPPASPTDAGRACLLMRRAGCIGTNPAHPDLLAALAAGVTPEALGSTAAEALELGKSKPFTWAIATAQGRLDESRNPAKGSNRNGTTEPRQSLLERAAQRAVERLAIDHGDN